MKDFLLYLVVCSLIAIACFVILASESNVNIMGWDYEKALMTARWLMK
jgi:hypothetical protein